MSRRTFSPRLERLENRCLLAFGDDGIVTADVFPDGDDWVQSVAIQSDGKIVAVGNAGIARFNIDGSLDSSFDGDGIRFVPGDLKDVQIQPDGRIVAAGGFGDFLIHRFNPDGSSDSTFDGDGNVTTDFKRGSDDRIHSIAVQPDGKIVAAGWHDTGIGGYRAWTVVRYNANGSLDTSFDGDGKLTTIFDKKRHSLANGVLLQPDGRIIVVGQTAAADGSWDFAVVRYHSNGSLDSTFGSGGKVTTDFKSEHTRTLSHDIARNIALQLDGKLVVVGGMTTGPYFAAARYDQFGKLDSTFAGDGKQVLHDPNGDGFDGGGIGFYGVELEPPDTSGAQNIVAAGSGNATYVARLHADGTLDPSFDGDGWQWFLFSDPPPNPTSSSDILALQSDGKIVVGGAATSTTGYNAAVARLNPDGSFDADGTPCHQGWLCLTSSEAALTASDVDLALLAILADDASERRRRK